MGIIVKLKVNRSITAEHWKKDALGVIDEYGNPFRIIRLRWRNTPLHRMTDYAKMRGFEDAVIGKDNRTNDISITYRKNGSVSWIRTNGIGSFFGEVAQTPRNMALLASHYGDRLFDIVDDDINQIANKMYEERRKAESPDLKAFNDTRIAKMHVAGSDYKPGDPKLPEVPLEVEQASVVEANRLNAIKKADLDAREAALDKRSQGILDKTKDLVEAGVQPTTYSKDYLEGLKFYELRKLCKEVGVSWTQEDKKVELIQKIVSKQTGVPAATGVIGGLDS